MEFHIQKPDGTTREYPSIVGATWATFNAYRNLGFPADDLYVVEGSGGEIVVQLRAQGKEFNAVVGVLRPAQVAGFFADWREFSDDVARIPEWALAKAYDMWLAAQEGAGLAFVAAIVARGIQLPRGAKLPVPGQAAAAKRDQSLN